MKKSLCILSICFAAFACCSACKKYNNPENPSDPKTEIINAVKDAALPVYFEETIAEANGRAIGQPAATFIYVTHDLIELGGGEQENVGLPVMGIIVFDKCQENVPDALYLGGGNCEKPVKVEKIEMVTPELAVVIIGGGIVAMGATPIPLVTEVDGAPADSYLVDLKTILGGQMAKIDVRRTEEVENNLEHFENMAFLHMLCIGGSVRLSSIDQVKKIEIDGPEKHKFVFEPVMVVGDISYMD